MKLSLDKYEIEGTPAEIAEFLQQYDNEFSTTQEATQISATEGFQQPQILCTQVTQKLKGNEIYYLPAGQARTAREVGLQILKELNLAPHFYNETVNAAVLQLLTNAEGVEKIDNSSRKRAHQFRRVHRVG